MKFLSIAVALLGTVHSLVEASVANDKFHKYTSHKPSPVELDERSYEELTSAPRDYHVAVLLTARDVRFGCQICRDFQPEWEIIARSWNKAAPESTNLVFGTLDFAEGRGVFQKMMLQTAPVLLVFPPTTTPKNNGQPFRFDFTAPTTAEKVYSWISRNLPEGPKPPIQRPINYARIASVCTVILGVVSIITALSRYIMPVLYNRNLWMAGSLISILMFTSGHMFNHIRKSPYVAGDGKGGVSYFAAGFSSQYGMESQIVAAVYGVLSLATIALVMKAPSLSSAKSQQVSVVVWSGIMWMGYSLLLSLFRIKNSGYPLSLPPF